MIGMGVALEGASREYPGSSESIKGAYAFSTRVKPEEPEPAFTCPMIITCIIESNVLKHFHLAKFPPARTQLLTRGLR